MRLKTVKLIIGYIMLVVAGGIVILKGVVFSSLNPAMTQTQVFLENWPYYLLAAVLLAVGYVLVNYDAH